MQPSDTGHSGSKAPRLREYTQFVRLPSALNRVLEGRERSRAHATRGYRGPRESAISEQGTRGNAFHFSFPLPHVGPPFGIRGHGNGLSVTHRCHRRRTDTEGLQQPF